MQKDYDAYVATASFLSPSRIPRLQLPNLQDVTIDKNAVPKNYEVAEDGSVPLVDDCELEDLKYKMNPLDVVLLAIFRSLVEKNTNGVTSDKKGILGLVEQARTFMLQPGQTAEAQHKMVSDTLAGLMTPVLPPFYRIFMSGIVPNIGTKWDGKQIGPWFYAPWLTTIVTPIFFGFLVGPSYPNRRKDGHLGGLVVEKCKFLQESGCKGICLHDCKLPTQEFFQEELGLSLTVSPNFVTQECQWSFGETPLPPSEDKSFPQGCLNGCDSRKALVAMGSAADACN
jgi:beta-carotene isomerase